MQGRLDELAAQKPGFRYASVPVSTSVSPKSAK
jgi:hypothetical protein